jgi:hypothetical protein
MVRILQVLRFAQTFTDLEAMRPADGFVVNNPYSNVGYPHNAYLAHRYSHDLISTYSNKTYANTLDNNLPYGSGQYSNPLCGNTLNGNASSNASYGYPSSTYTSPGLYPLDYNNKGYIQQASVPNAYAANAQESSYINPGRAMDQIEPDVFNDHYGKDTYTHYLLGARS